MARQTSEITVVGAAVRKLNSTDKPKGKLSLKSSYGTTHFAMYETFVAPNVALESFYILRLLYIFFFNCLSGLLLPSISLCSPGIHFMYFHVLYLFPHSNSFCITFFYIRWIFVPIFCVHISAFPWCFQWFLYDIFFPLFSHGPLFVILFSL